MAQTGFTPILIYGSTTPGNTPSAGDLATTSSGVEMAVNAADGKLFYKDNLGAVQVLATKAGANGDVVGPGSSTDNALARFDGTTGKLIQNSVVTIADSTGNMAGVGTLGVGAITTSGALTYGGVTLSNSVTGTGSMVLSTSPTLVTPALGTPSSVTLTNATGLPVATGISGLGAGVATFLATPSSANLAAAVTDETGTGALVFANSPTLVTPALGTPASGVVTNLTGTASININGTVGATTANTGAFTTLAASGAVTLSGGTANGVSYLNSSKVLTTGSALTFDGTNFATTGFINTAAGYTVGGLKIGGFLAAASQSTSLWMGDILNNFAGGTAFFANGSEAMRLTSTGLGIGTSSPTNALSVTGNANVTGNVTLGDATTDTVQVNGYMGVGGAGSANAALNVVSTALTSTAQFGVVGNITGSSAATSQINAVWAGAKTAVAAFTSTNVSGFRVADATKGAGSTITNLHGVYIEDQTQGTNNFGITSLVSSGTNKWNIYASGTAANYFAGNVQFAAGSAAAPALTRFGDDNTGIFFPAADTIAFAEGGAEAMRINSFGQVGIGTSSPSQALDVRSAGTANISLETTSGPAGIRVVSLASGTAGVTLTSSAGTQSILGGLGSVNNMVFNVNSTERMRIDSSGNLLVGLTSATGVALLQVSGPIRTTGYTVATLPAGTVGMRTYVTDALAPAFGVAVAGSGAVTIPVFYDGANWIVA